MLRTIPLLFLAAFAFAEEPVPPFEEPQGVISLRAAIDAALLHNPQLTPFSWDERIGDARITQARLRPNPELSVEIENIRVSGGDGGKVTIRTLGLSSDGVVAELDRHDTGRASSLFEDTEATLLISQLIELGGKRGARIAAAERGKEVLGWDYEVARFNVVGEVVARFADVLAAQERLGQEREVVALAEQLSSSVSQMVDAGSVSPLEARRAQAETEHARINLQAREREWEQARLRLAAMWGSTTPQFASVDGGVNSAALPELPALETLLTQRQEHPALRRWAAELARREAVLTHERKLRLPDLTIGLGYRATATQTPNERGFSVGTEGITGSRSYGGGEDWKHSIVVEASIPLPLFHRNQGAIKEAELMVRRLSDEQRAWEAEVVAVLTEQHALAGAASERLTGLAQRVLPELDKTFALTREGYERGKFSFLNVLEAQRAVATARVEILDARITFYQAVAEMERIIGARIDGKSATLVKEHATPLSERQNEDKTDE